MDVIEIDAASNTGVDNIRTLNEQVQFTPVECLYKVYIIDEVHMLSIGAFNALLKTLEEPPKNVVFILATTEPHKIPVTIQSRCQKLNFRKLSFQEISGHLQMICDAESIKGDSDAIALITRNSDGCVRDALSLLEQLNAYNSGTISYENVIQMLGATSDVFLVDLLKGIFTGNKKKVLDLTTTFFESGGNPMQFMTDVINVLKDLLLIRFGKEDEVGLSGDQIKELKTISDGSTETQILEAVDLFSKLESELRWFSRADLVIQIKILGLANHFVPESTVEIRLPIENARVSETPMQPHSSQIETAKPGVKPAMSNRSNPRPISENTTASSNVNEEVPKSLTDVWNKVLELTKQKKPMLYAILTDSKPVDLLENSLQISLSGPGFFRLKLEEEANQVFFSDLLFALLGRACTMTIVDKKVSTEVADNGSEKEEIKTEESKESPKNNMHVNRIIDMFEGKTM